MTNQSFTFRNALIKLRKRHFLEWETLAATQQKMLALVLEEDAFKFAPQSEYTLASIRLKNKQTVRLAKIMSRQYEERLQLKERHRQEEALLEQMVDRPKEIQTEPLLAY